MSKRRVTLTRTPRKRLEAAIAVHEDIVARHPPNTETHKYSQESLTKLRAELARRGRRTNPTVRASPKLLKQMRQHEYVDRKDGVEVGQYTDSPHGHAVVKSIHRYGKTGEWQVGIWNVAGGYREAIPLKALTRRGKKRRISGCYAVGPAPIRRRKVNREGSTVAKGKRRPVSGCYVVGKARRRRRKANPLQRRKRPVPCYKVGKGRIRRRKMNRRPGGVAVYAQGPGRAPRYVGSVSRAVASVLRRTGAARLTRR
jgi:hypothetical protein